MSYNVFVHVYRFRLIVITANGKSHAILFFIGWALYRKHPEKVGTGFFFGLCLAYIFTFRFFIEYTKDIQEAFEADMILNMGQLLSIPFIVLGAVCMARSRKIK